MLSHRRMESSTSARIQALTSFGDDGVQLLALEELNQMLSLGQQGEVRVSAYVPALIRVIERAESNAQVVLMAVRALIQIVDIEPRSGALAVSEGVLPAICSRLLSISDLDVAEQCIKCLNVLSATHARDILRAGGLKAVTAFIDFFPQHLQRIAVETAAVLCGDAGRQIEDAVNVLDAIPTLTLCLESSDDKVLTYASQCFARLVACYSTSASNGTSQSKQLSRYTQPTLEAIRALQAFASSSQSKDPNTVYVDLDLTPFQPKYGPNWRKQVMTMIGTTSAVSRLLAIMKKRPADDASHLLSALARVCRSCPQVIPTLINEGILEILEIKLSPTGSSKSGEALTAALRVIQAMLPPVPHAKAFDRTENGELCDRDKFDASLVATPDEKATAYERQMHLLAKIAGAAPPMEAQSADHGLVAEDEGYWACPLCTFHNSSSATSCDMCGQVSPQISERASRFEGTSRTGMETDADKGKNDVTDAASVLEKLLLSWEDYTLGITSCSQLYKEQPELLESIAEVLLPNLTQVAAKSANPDHRTRALGALASFLYTAPRHLLEQVGEMYGPGGKYYTGVVQAGLQSQNPHVVGSALRVAMVELWRLGIRPGLKREGIPQLVRGLGSRFPESSGLAIEAERIQSLRRRAAHWLDQYDYLSESEAMSGTASSQTVSDFALQLRSLADRLANANQPLEVDSLSTVLERKVSISPKLPLDESETPPNKKRRRISANSFLAATPQRKSELSHNSLLASRETIFHPILRDLSSLLAQGVVSSEFQTSGLAQIMANLANTRQDFVQALKDVFEENSAKTAFIRTLHDALDTAERFAVIKHGSSSGDSFRAMKSQSRIVLQVPAPVLKKLATCLKPVLSLDELEEDFFAFPLKVDPLIGVNELESYIWSQIKSKVAELRTAASRTGAAAGSKRGAQSVLSSSPNDSERDESRFAILQAGDPVHVVKYMKPGVKVTRGRDWKWGDQDGGPGRTGVVTDVRSWNGHPNSCIRVRWDVNKATNVYRYNVEDAFDLALAPRAPSRPVRPSGKSSFSISERDISKRSTEAFRLSLKRDDQIEAMDSFHRWYPAVVRVVVPRKDSREGAARVSFQGFGPQFDEWIPLCSERLAPASSRIFVGGFDLGDADDSADEIIKRELNVVGITASSTSTGNTLSTAVSPLVAELSRTSQDALPQTTNAVVSHSLEEDVDDEDASSEVSIQELPSTTRVRCPLGEMIVQAGMIVQLKRVNEDAWWEGVLLQLGSKPKQTKVESVLTNVALEQETVTAESAQGDDDKATDNVIEDESKTDDDNYDPVESEKPTLQDLSAPASTSSAQQSFLNVSDDKTTSYFALVKPISKSEVECGEEEEDDDDEEDNAEWIPLSEVNIRASDNVRQARHASAEEETATVQEIKAGDAAFAKVGILGRESWIPVNILSADEIDSFQVQTRFGLGDAEFTFDVPRVMIQTHPPRAAFSPSATDLRLLMKSLREMEEFEGRDGETSTVMNKVFRGRSSGGMILGISDDDTLRHAEATLAAAAAAAERADVDDDPLDEDTTSRSPIPQVAVSQEAPAVNAEEENRRKRNEHAKALFVSSRSRTLMRDYSGIDLTSELAASSIHHSLSAAAAISTRLSFSWSEEGPTIGDDSSSLSRMQKQLANSPIRLSIRNQPEETIHLCLARLSSKDDYVGGLGGITPIDYLIDFSNPQFEAFINSMAPSQSDTTVSSSRAHLVEISGNVSILDDDIYTVNTNFPTICPLDVQLNEKDTAWFFEVEVVQAGLAQIGWIDTECICDDASGRGCGDDLHGWAFDGKRKVKWHVESQSWGKLWSDGDVLGIGVRFKEGNACDIYFSLNGSFAAPMGLAFENQTFVGALRPAITFNRTFSCKVRLQDFRYPPSDQTFRPIATAAKVDAKPADQDAMTVESSPTPGPEPQTTASPAPAAEDSCADVVDESFFNTIFDVAEPLPPAAQTLKLLSDLSLCEDQQQLVNRRLTNKLVWQLQDALAVCSRTLPQWCFRAVQDYPFLFPYETRQILFQSTALGVSRALYRYSTEYEQEATAHNSGRGRGIESVSGSVGTQLKRQKVVLPRIRALETGMKLMQRFASNKCVLTMEFAEEIGHGLGPTLEFYSIICRELQRKDIGLWRYPGHSAVIEVATRIETVQDNSENSANLYINSKNGLFPAVLAVDAPANVRSRVLSMFTFLGRFLARAILDDRLLDLDFSELFLEKLIQACDVSSTSFGATEDVDENLAALTEIDPEFAKSLQNLSTLDEEYRKLCSLPASSDVEKQKLELKSQVECLQLDNILPGTEDVKIPNFDSEIVTIENCKAYVQHLACFLCEVGVQPQLAACREGFSQVFDVAHLRAFTTAELRDMLGGARDDIPWTTSEIIENMVLRDYTKDSPQIVNLVQVLSELDKQGRRLFLRFLTGTPRLPVGGWAALRPKFSVVKKSSAESDGLPSCSTCSVVLKLPQYSSKTALKEKLLFAINEGQNFFSMD